MCLGGYGGVWTGNLGGCEGVGVRVRVRGGRCGGVKRCVGGVRWECVGSSVLEWGRWQGGFGGGSVSVWGGGSVRGGGGRNSL